MTISEVAKLLMAASLARSKALADLNAATAEVERWTRHLRENYPAEAEALVTYSETRRDA